MRARTGALVWGVLDPSVKRLDWSMSPRSTAPTTTEIYRGLSSFVSRSVENRLWKGGAASLLGNPTKDRRVNPKFPPLKILPVVRVLPAIAVLLLEAVRPGLKGLEPWNGRPRKNANPESARRVACDRNVGSADRVPPAPMGLILGGRRSA